MGAVCLKKEKKFLKIGIQYHLPSSGLIHWIPRLCGVLNGAFQISFNFFSLSLCLQNFDLN
jgi:hypothetical protein